MTKYEIFEQISDKKENLSKQIEKFSSDIRLCLYDLEDLSFDPNLDREDKPTSEEIAKLRVFCRVWCSLANGVRNILH